RIEETRRKRGRRTAIVSVLYAAVVITLALMTAKRGDDHWFFTVLLFSPRWVYAVPMALLVPVAVLRSRGLGQIIALVALGAMAALLIRFNDVHLLWRAVSQESDLPKGKYLRVMTYNIGGGTFTPGSLVTLITETDPDIVGLEECEDIPVDAL